jgi:very-short-patch-repair endonuclease
MGDKPAPDLIIARLAAKQHGIATHQQLREAGLGRNSISHRARTGRLHRIHRGVYALGHAGLAREGRWMAAVLACGDTAVLSHRSAAALWRLLPASAGPVHVSIATRSGREKRTGIRLHRPKKLPARQVTLRHRIPVTTPARTIADLHRMVPPPELREAIRQAAVLGLPVEVEPGREPTRSELEHRFLRLCERHRLPKPLVNHRVGRLEVDFLWPEQRVVVETDGYRYHRGRAAFEDDRSRDLQLRDAGFDVIRLTYRQVAEEPTRVIDSLRRILNERNSL